jgi:hypothetical protein
MRLDVDPDGNLVAIANGHDGRVCVVLKDGREVKFEEAESFLYRDGLCVGAYTTLSDVKGRL